MLHTIVCMGQQQLNIDARTQIIGLSCNSLPCSLTQFCACTDYATQLAFIALTTPSVQLTHTFFELLL